MICYVFFILGFFSFDVFLEFSRHLFGQIVDVFVWFRNPSKDAVELKDNARASAFVTEKLFLGALGTQQFDIKVAHLALSWPLVKAAAGEVLAAASHSIVSCTMEMCYGHTA